MAGRFRKADTGRILFRDQGMQVHRTLRAASAATLVSAAVGCGDASVAIAVRIDLPAAPIPGESRIVLGGRARLPDGSVRTGGTPTVPWITCQPGPYSMSWRNSANGAQGVPVAWWDCSRDSLSWSSGSIPLAPGANRVTVSYTDRLDGAQASIEIRLD
jgi:hypothetical protein